MRVFLLSLVSLSTCLLPCRGQNAEPPSANQREQVTVGDRPVKIPAPAGFVRVDGVNAEEDRAVAALLAASNRYLARFEPDKANGADAGRNFSAQVMRKLETIEIGERTFEDFKAQTKAELDRLQKTIQKEMETKLAEAEKKHRDVTGVDLALSVSDVTVLGYFDESPGSFGFTMAMNVAAKVEDGAAKVRGVVAGMIVPVNGRLIYLYANADFKSPADQQWAENSVTAWRDAVRAVNPRLQGPSGKNSLFDGAGRSAIIGAIAGAVGGLVAMLLRKKKAAKAP